MTDEAVGTATLCMACGYHHHPGTSHGEGPAYDPLVQRLREAEERAEQAEANRDGIGDRLEDAFLREEDLRARIQELEDGIRAAIQMGSAGLHDRVMQQLQALAENEA